MKKSSKAQLGKIGKAERERDGRFDQFRAEYLRTGNAYRAAIFAGYTKGTAKTASFAMAREVKATIAEALRARGLDEVSQARKLFQLQNARCVKFNPELGEFENFEDGDVQMRATQEINRLLDAYPAPKEAADQRSVQIIFPASFGAVAVQKETKQNG